MSEGLVPSRLYQSQLEAISELARELSRAKSLREIYDKALECVQGGLQVDRSALLISDEAGVMRFKSWRRLSDQYRAAVEGHSPWPPDAKRPEPVLVPDISSDVTLNGLHEVIQKEGIGALAFIPLVSRGRLIGKFMLYYDKQHQFGEDEVLLAQSMANHVAFAVDRVQAEEHLRESEERYRQLVELSPEPIAVHIQGKLVYVNAAGARLVGARSAEELIGRSIFDFVPQEYTELALERIRTVEEQGQPAALVEEKLRTLKGEALDVELVSIPITFEGQKGSQIVIRDITERKRAEEALREAEEKYRGIFENALFGIFQTTPDGRFLSANEALARMFGYASVDELKETVRDIGQQIHVDPARREEFTRLLQESGFVFGFESPARRKDGTIIWISVTARAAQDTDGDGIYYEGVVEDVSARKEAERRLAGQYEVTRLLTEAETVEEAVQGILRAICQTLNSDVGQYWTVDEDAGVMRCIQSASLPGADMPAFREFSRKTGLPAGVGIPGRAWSSGEPVWVADLAQHQDFPRAPVAIKEGGSALCAFPITIAGETCGVIEFVSRRKREPDDELMEAMASVGQQLGRFIEHRRAEEAVRTRERQQESVSRLGAEAIRGTPVQPLMEQAVKLVSEGLGVEYVEALALLPGANGMLLRAGVGWRSGLVASAIIPAGRDSQAGYTLLAQEPVVVRDLRTEERFSAAALLLEHGVVSGISIIIPGTEGPFGVLGAHTKKRRAFSEDDVNFMRSMSNVLAESIARARSEEALRESEAKTAAIVNTAVDGIITVDERGVVQSYNPAAARLFGYEPEEVVGQKVNLLMTAPEHEEHDTYIANYLATGVRKIIGIGREVTGRRKDGTLFPMELSISELHLDGQRMFTAIVRDITGRKRADEERERLLAQIEAERQRVNNLVEDVPGVVWEAYGEPDKGNQRTEYVSGHVEKMLGYTVEQWFSTPNFWLNIVVEEDRERAAQEAAEAFAGKRLPVSQFRWRAKDGRIVWVEAKSAVIRDKTGQPIGMRGVTMDITERRLAEERRAFLAEASSILSSSLDYRATVQEVARLAVGSIADVCSIELVEGETLRRAGLAHRDAGAEKRLQAADHIHPMHWDENPCVRTALSMRPQLYPHVSDADIAGLTEGEADREMVRSLRLRSLITVPIFLGKRPLGLLTLGAAASRPPFTREDLGVAEELGRRAGIAVDNARLYEAEQEARRVAENATSNLSRLQKLTEAALASLSVSDLLNEMIWRIHEMLRVDTTTVFLLERDGHTLIAQAAVGLEEEVLGELRIPLGTGVAGTIAAAQRGRIINDMSGLRPASPVLRARSVRAMMGVPLTVEGRLLGVLEVASVADRQFSADDFSLLQLAGDRVALAVDHARLFEGEQEARMAAEAAAAARARLQKATAAFSEAATPAEVAQTIVEQVLTAMDASAGTVCLTTKDPEEMEVVAYRGYSDELMQEWRRFSAARPDAVPLFRAVRENRSLFIESPQAAGEESATLGQMTGNRAWAIVPLSLHGRVDGAIWLAFDEPRTFDEDDREYLRALARLAAQALERARLYEEEQAARTDAETAAARQTFLARASDILGSSLDYETTLASLARLCVPYLGDWCAIDIAEDDGNISRVAVVHSDPRKVRLARKLQERYPPEAAADTGIRKILQTGEAQFFPEISDDLLRSLTPDKELVEIVQGLGLRSSMTLPLSARGRVLGALSLVMAESGRRYTEEDLTFAQDLAGRAALAVDNARLYRDSQRVQEQLRVANEAKDEFLGMVSHELRTPITTIYGGTRLLAAQSSRFDEESKAEILRDIEQEAERLHRIVEDLLVLARMELGQELVTEPVLVQRVIEKAVAVLLKRRPIRKVSMQVNGELEPVNASAGYLEQILRNLLNNANKYSPVTEPIDVFAKQSNGEVVITVADRGPGIPKEEAELIFERFYRSGRTAKTAGGAGIGLTVCKRLVEAQGGRIWAQPREGGGTEVSFSLPVYTETEV